VGPEAALISHLSRTRQHIVEIARAGIRAAGAGTLVRAALAGPAGALLSGRTLHVVAAGKAAVPMAGALAAHAGGRVRAGLVCGTHGGEALVPPLEWLRGGHPLPTASSLAAARRALELAVALVEGDLLVVLLSGGASALLAAPAGALSLDDKIAATRTLLRAGIDIYALNAVRKHLSAIKGGRLAAAARTSLTLAISDVTGAHEDDPSVIGSGPTAADPTTFADALAVVERVERNAPGSFPGAALHHLEQGAAGRIEETPKPGDPRLKNAGVHVIGGRREALAGAASAARALGYHVVTIDEAVTGDAREAGRAFARAALRSGEPGTGRCVIGAGETTVHVTGGGAGGRNQEFALGAAEELAALEIGVGVTVASIATDGVDGPTDAAGAFADPTTIGRARSAGLRAPAAVFADNDTYPFFDRLGDLIRLGPTDTNVGDLQIAVAGTL
jgi:glycerate-2-kinase